MNWKLFWDVVLAVIVGSVVLGVAIEQIGGAISTVVDWFRREPGRRRDEDDVD